MPTDKDRRVFKGAIKLYDLWMDKKRRLLDEYQFPGFRPRSRIKGIFGDPRARIIRLERTQKKRHAVAAAPYIAVTTTKQYDAYGICPAGRSGYIWKWKSGESAANGVAR
jgi:hypothetical protein